MSKGDIVTAIPSVATDSAKSICEGWMCFHFQQLLFCNVFFCANMLSDEAFGNQENLNEDYTWIADRAGASKG
jgi:hypothetical protein